MPGSERGSSDPGAFGGKKALGAEYRGEHPGPQLDRLGVTGRLVNPLREEEAGDVLMPSEALDAV
jgi:hypothetical protein